MIVMASIWLHEFINHGDVVNGFLVFFFVDLLYLVVLLKGERQRP